MAAHGSSAAPLAGIYAALVVYASLYPFTGWQLPGESVWAFLSRPWWRWWTWFDLIANLVGYLPLGALAFGACVRSGWTASRSFAVACASGALLSLSLETLQNFLPGRIPSNVDLALNAAGTALGALVGLAVHLAGMVDRWQSVRERWFIDSSAGGLALLVLWPLGLLFPGPVPFAFGQFLPRLRDAAADWLQDSAAAPWFEPWLRPDDSGVLSSGSEFAAIALGLLAPCLVAFTISWPGWRRIVLALGAVATGLVALTLSTALNFGPQHSLAWRTPPVEAALAAGFLGATALAWLPRRAAAGVGLITLTALVTLVAQVPPDAYVTESLQGWEQGRFIRFHGAAQWIGWLWPYVAIGWLLARIAARDSA